jgi:hypothetical protein
MIGEERIALVIYDDSTIPSGPCSFQTGVKFSAVNPKTGEIFAEGNSMKTLFQVLRNKGDYVEKQVAK